MMNQYDASKPKAEQGLYRKYEVTRTDGDPQGKHRGCHYFVLDLTHDAHAGPALAAYARSCEGDYPVLSEQLKGILKGATRINSTLGSLLSHPKEEPAQVEGKVELTRYGFTVSMKDGSDRFTQKADGPYVKHSDALALLADKEAQIVGLKLELEGVYEVLRQQNAGSEFPPKLTQDVQEP